MSQELLKMLLSAVLPLRCLVVFQVALESSIFSVNLLITLAFSLFAYSMMGLLRVCKYANVSCKSIRPCWYSSTANE
jgi:hypothetical protein